MIKLQAFFIEHLRWLLRGFLKTWRLLKNIFPDNFLGKVPRKAFVTEAKYIKVSELKRYIFLKEILP